MEKVEMNAEYQRECCTVYKSRTVRVVDRLIKCSIRALLLSGTSTCSMSGTIMEMTPCALLGV